MVLLAVEDVVPKELFCWVDTFDRRSMKPIIIPEQIINQVRAYRTAPDGPCCPDLADLVGYQVIDLINEEIDKEADKRRLKLS
jgi:hypothetical protein